jgi:hypothetical protein
MPPSVPRHNLSRPARPTISFSRMRQPLLTVVVRIKEAARRNGFLFASNGSDTALFFGLVVALILHSA